MSILDRLKFEPADLQIIGVQLGAMLVGAVLHEVAHGYSAYKLGDNTAKEAGRLTLNPLKHIDLFSTILLPLAMILAGMPALFLFKPVPVNMNKLRNPRRDSRIVALSGPLTNFAIVLLTAAIFQAFLWNIAMPDILKMFLAYLIFINLLLGAFNLIPIPPLDGSWVLQSFLPERALIGYEKVRTWFVLIFLVLIFSGLFSVIWNPVYGFLSNVTGILLSPGLLRP